MFLNDSARVLNVPKVVALALATLAAVHVVRLLAPSAADAWFVWAMAFVPARYDGFAESLPGGAPAAVLSFASHALVHADAAHLLLNGAWLLVFGGAVAQRVGAVRFLVLSLCCASAGAAAFLTANWALLAPMIGASGMVAGLMGATIRFLFSAADQGGLHLLRTNPRSVRLMPLSSALRDKRVLAVTGVWLAINLLAAFGAEAVTGGAIAWESHLGGYFAGFLLFGAFDGNRAGFFAPPGKLT